MQENGRNHDQNRHIECAGVKLQMGYVSAEVTRLIFLAASAIDYFRDSIDPLPHMPRLHIIRAVHRDGSPKTRLNIWRLLEAHHREQERTRSIEGSK